MNMTDRQYALVLIDDLRTRYSDKALDELLFLMERTIATPGAPTPPAPNALFGMLTQGKRFRRTDGHVTRTYTVHGLDIRSTTDEPKMREWHVVMWLRDSRTGDSGAREVVIPLNHVIAHIMTGELRPLAEGET